MHTMQATKVKFPECSVCNTAVKKGAHLSTCCSTTLCLDCAKAVQVCPQCAVTPVPTILNSPLDAILTDVRKANKSKVNIWLASTANVPADITITANATVPEDHVVLLLNMLHQLRFPTSVAATTVAKPPAQMGRSFAVFAENSAVRTMPNVGEHCVISVSWGTVNCTVYLFQ